MSTEKPERTVRAMASQVPEPKYVRDRKKLESEEMPKFLQGSSLFYKSRKITWIAKGS